MPKVSVIMPVHNRRHLIQRAIESVLQQTFSEWELLIVDDGSTDGLEALVVPLLEKYTNIRYLRHARRGVALTRNIGIHAALGQYITFLDSDDEYTPDHLRVRVEYIESQTHVDVVHGGVELIGPEETFWVQDAFDSTKKIHISECCVGSTFLGRKEAFLLAGGFKDLSYSAESELLPRLESMFYVEKVDFPTYRYYTGLEDSVCTLRQKADSHA